jgi:hypothetical protein
VREVSISYKATRFRLTLEALVQIKNAQVFDT